MALVEKTDWSKKLVACHECGAPVWRRQYHPTTRRPLTAFFCNYACKALYQKRSKPVTKEWLETKYVMERCDCVQIGAMVNRDPKSVWNWLKDFGIPTRTRGDPENGCHSFRKGGASPFKGKKQKRGVESPHWQGGITPQRQEFYASVEWRAAVKAVFARDKKSCRRCEMTQSDLAKIGMKLHVHHIVGFRVKHLRCVISNLVLLCKSCHLFVHSRENTDRIFLEGTDHAGGRPSKRAQVDVVARGLR